MQLVCKYGPTIGLAARFTLLLASSSVCLPICQTHTQTHIHTHTNSHTHSTHKLKHTHRKGERHKIVLTNSNNVCWPWQSLMTVKHAGKVESFCLALWIYSLSLSLSLSLPLSLPLSCLSQCKYSC